MPPVRNDPVSPFPFTPVRFPWNMPPFPADSEIVSIGSCFAEDLVSVLLNSGFHGVQNPNGILYNPVSISLCINHLEIPYKESDFFEFNGLYHSWMHHGAYSSNTLEHAVQKCETARLQFYEALKHAGVFFLTYSSSVVYELLDTLMIVSNCHKVPNSRFLRRLLSAEEVNSSIHSAIETIHRINPECRIILTLSPLRHYPGELLLNSRSKALLLNGIWQAVEKSQDLVAYFPVYEIVMDEFRDYRFYAEDLLHLNDYAKSLILKRFLQTCFVPDALARLEQAEQMRRKACHIQKTES